jgi:hypothetical protein
MVDANSKIYVIAGKENVETLLYCLDPEGTDNWSFKIQTGSGSAPWGIAPMAIDKLGNIYTGYDTLFVVDYSGQLKWSFALKNYDFISAPILIDKDNAVYFDERTEGDFVYNAFSNDGLKIWTAQFPKSGRLYYSPAIGFDNKMIIPGYKANFLFSID